MPDASTIALGLAFGATVALAFLMFVGQVISFLVLLCLAAAAQLLAGAFQLLKIPRRKSS